MFVRLLISTFAAILIATEVLSVIGLLGRVSVGISWLFFSAAAARQFGQKWSCPKLGWVDSALTFAIVFIAAGTGLTALASPPNSVDAFGYHLSRVVWWVQQGSVRFFPTPYYPQVSMPPLAEYAMLHAWLLWGSDRLVNLVQWAGFIGSIAAVALIARELGAGTRGQAIAAVFCATLPNAILQASGAKNECVLAFCLAAMAYFALQWSEAPDGVRALWVGFALGLALATKATALIFAPPLLVACVWTQRRAALRTLAPIALCVLAVNLPQWWRNTATFSSPLGPPNAQATQGPEYRWTNARPGWRTTTSNLLRHASQQLGGRSEPWNRTVYEIVLSAHRVIAADPNDPATTWPGTAYTPPVNSNHEADSPNRVHLFVLVGAVGLALWRRSRTLGLAAALLTAFVLVCIVLKYQPYFGRVFLPLFVLGAALVGSELAEFRIAGLLVCLLLFDQARNPLLRNWTRPLVGPQSVLRTRRDANYFRDMGQFGLGEADYRRAAELAVEGGCRTVAIDNSRFHLEYPLQMFLLRHDPRIRFVRPGPADRACAVVELGRPITVQRRGGRITAATTAPAVAIPASVR